ncbi:F-box protein At1g49360-like [Mercurialis annua]|uniref:F-box protein At1g49360-like n=1 Tax=Mercurialis annua TaxID=3986 RepID=UPI00215DF47C|nr:F-box protein At1g49360-like [Mercurialis annua]
MEKSKLVMGDCWKEVPVEIIWLIMEKLHSLDNIRLAAVCKEFRHAFTRLPAKLHHSKDAVPWLLIMNKPDLDFIRVSTLTTLKIRIAKKHQSNVPLCSSNGWLLAARDSNPGCYGYKSRMFLLNPFTKEKFRMPATLIYRFAISVANGKPQFVLAANLRRTDGISTVILRICRPGDTSWTTVARSSTGLFSTRIASLCVAGDKIYCVDERGWVKIYDMKSCEWKETAMAIPSYDRDNNTVTEIAEKDGELRRVDIYFKYLLKNTSKRKTNWDLTFYRLNEEKMEWELLSEGDIKDTSWFIGNPGCSYLGKGKPRIYFISSEGYLVVSDIYKPIQKDTHTRHLFTRRNNPIPHYPLDNNLFWFDMD